MSNLKTFPQAPYFDDFDEDKGFVQVLFRPKFPVQTRELNQLQTILQNQIGILGDSFFEDGSRVFGGETQFNTKASFVKLKEPLSRSNKTDYIGATVTNGTLSAKIVHVEAETGSDPETIYVIYEGNDSVDYNIVEFSADQPLVITLLDSSIEQSSGSYVLETSTTSPVGFGTTVSISKGVFYLNSRFIAVPSQTLVISKYASIDNTSYSVGISAQEVIIAPEDDSSLLDNAAGSTNETAPGAHRFAVVGQFVQKENADAESDFIETIRIENQQVIEQVRNTELSVINDILAKRTYDESGDYVVDEFLLDIREHLKSGDNLGIFEAPTGIESKIVYTLDPGKAYVRGYAVETIANTNLEAPKARTTASHESVVTSLQYEAKVTVANILSALPELFKSVYLYDGVGTIGIAYIRNVKYVSVGVFDIELTGIKMNPGYSIADVTVIEGTTNTFIATVTGYSVDPTNSSLVFELPYNNVQVATGVILDYNAKFDGFIVSGVDNTVILSHQSDTFSADESDYVVSYVSGGILRVIAPTSVSVGINTVTITFPLSPVPDTTSAKVICKMTRTNGVARTKTSVTAPSMSIVSAASMTLGHADVYKIDSIISGSIDIKDRYVLNNGQTDTTYEVSSISLKAGEVVPSGNVVVTYKYFDHGIGDFFVAQSYDVDYSDIPTYKTSSGNEIFLADSIDFRSKTNGTTVDVNESITANSFDANGRIIFDMSHYLPRIDKIAIDTKGKFSVINGIPAIKPESPKEPEDAIVLYELDIPAYTFKTSDITVKKRQQRRYTMKDIGNLERRIENLEYVTTLNLLEVDAANRNFPNLFKTGFIVDNFETQLVADTSTLSELRCSFDLVSKVCRPEISYTNVNIEVESSTGLTVVNDMAMLPYTEMPVVSQLLASTTERIQPFIRYSFTGNLSISPSTDTWFSTQFRPDIVLDRGTLSEVVLQNNSRGFGNNWGFWRNNWTGLSIQKANFSQLTSTSQLRDSVLNTSAIPFIRSRRIRFSVSGMKPNTRVYPYFDGVDVSSFCGMTAVNQPIITSAAGTITDAIFDIPNSSVARFRTGVRNFKLVDDKDNPTTEAVAVYSSTGTVIERQRDFVSTRLFPIVKRKWVDPVAQSFIVNEDGGCFITSIDMFFGPEVSSNQFPVTLQVRNMVNGYPGENVVAKKTIPAASLVGSSNASVATKFTFDVPFHLEKSKEYCFVVMTDSEQLTLWSSKLGERNVVGNQVISKQPYLGSMFKSQNNTTWTASQEQDIKFVINRAKFSVGSGTIVLENKLLTTDIGSEADTFKELIGDNVLSFLSGSNSVRVSHRNHGFNTGDTVFLTSTSSSAMNGVPATQVYAAGGKTVTVVDIDSYDISTTTAATSSGKNGVQVKATQKIVYSTAALSTDEIILNGTKIDWSMSVTDKTSSLVSVHDVTTKEDVSFNSEKIVVSDADNSLKVTAVLSNVSDNLSPMFDVSRTSVSVSRNRVDMNNMSQYVQKSFKFKNPANRLKVFLDANIPTSGASVEVQYRYGQNEVDSPWTTMTQVNTQQVTTNPNEFVEIEYTANSIPEFLAIQIRVVFKSNNPALAPRISNVRAIALFG